jgi:hypothetical protein
MIELTHPGHPVEAERRDRLPDDLETLRRDEVQIVALVLVVSVERHGTAAGQSGGDPSLLQRLTDQRSQLLLRGVRVDAAPQLELLARASGTLTLSVVDLYVRLGQQVQLGGQKGS